MRARLQLIGGALASIAAVGAIAGGLVGYWTVWKTLRADVFPESQKTQKDATARPDVAPRLSLVVLPFANLNNDAEQDYFADGLTTDLTTDLAQMPDTLVIGRGTAFTYKNKQIDLKALGKDLGIRWAVQGAVQRAGDRVRMNVSLAELSTGRDVWSDALMAIDRILRPYRSRSRRGSLALSTSNSSKPKADAAKWTDQPIQTLWISACAAGRSGMALGPSQRTNRQTTCSTAHCASIETTSTQ